MCSSSNTQVPPSPAPPGCSCRLDDAFADRDLLGGAAARGGDALGAEIGSADDVAGQHLVWAALEEQAAEVEHVDVGTDLSYQGHVVLDQQDAGAALGHYAGQHVAELDRLGGIEPGGGLVQEKQVEGSRQNTG